MEEMRLKRIEDNQKIVLETLIELKIGLMGSRKLGIEGTIPKVERHDQYIEKDKKLKWTIAGGISVISAFLTYLFQK
jgi:hypothetical protein